MTKSNNLELSLQSTMSTELITTSREQVLAARKASDDYISRKHPSGGSMTHMQSIPNLTTSVIRKDDTTTQQLAFSLAFSSDRNNTPQVTPVSKPLTSSSIDVTISNSISTHMMNTTTSSLLLTASEPEEQDMTAESVSVTQQIRPIEKQNETKTINSSISSLKWYFKTTTPAIGVQSKILTTIDVTNFLQQLLDQLLGKK